MGRAHIVSKMPLYAAAKLGLADQLAVRTKERCASLPASMDVHAPSLHRLMRTLASLGILTEQTGAAFCPDRVWARR